MLRTMTFAVATLALSTLVSAQVGEESEAKVPANATMPMPSLAPEGGLAGVPTFHMVMPGYSKEARKPNEQNAAKKNSSAPNTILIHHSTGCSCKSVLNPTRPL